MDLKTYLADLGREDRERLAAACGTSAGHLANVMYGFRQCSPELAVALELQTADAVTRQELRPEDWPRIWPELVPSAA